MNNSIVAIHNSYKNLKRLMAQAQIAHVELDRNLKITEWNSSAEDIFCYSAGDACGSYLSELVAPAEAVVQCNEELSRMLTSAPSDGVLSRNINRNGDELSCVWYYSPMVDGNGGLSGLSAMARNITEDEDSREKTQELNKKMEEFLGFAPIGIYQVNAEGRFTMANPEMAWMLGYESSSALIEQMQDIASQMFASDESAEKFFFQLYEAEQVTGFRCKLHRKNGKAFWANSYAKLLYNKEGRSDGFYGFSMDISRSIRTERKLQQANKELERIATLDGLTKIANRRRFDDYLASEWKRAIRDQRPLSLVLCDIDFFKPYNDNYGHQAGDVTLRKVAQCIAKESRRPADLAARYGGEEFVVVLPDTDCEGAMKVAMNMRNAVRGLGIPHEYSKAHHHVTISSGVSCMVPELQDMPESLIERADEALYQAKENGRDQVFEAPYPIMG